MVGSSAAGSAAETLTEAASTAGALEAETEAGSAGASEVAAVAVEKTTTCPTDTLSMKTKPSKLRLLTNNLKAATTKVAATINAPTTVAAAILNPNLLMEALPALKVTITALRTHSSIRASLNPGTMRPLSSELSLLLLSRNNFE